MRGATRAPIETTGELVAAIEAALPAAVRRSFGGGHPAKRVFQAIRIAVNDELDSLDRALPLAWELLRAGGRLAAISFHSLEDRRVKRFLAERARGCVCPPDFPVCVCGREPEAELLTGRAVVPTPGEVADNPRSQVGRLRVGPQAPNGGERLMARAAAAAAAPARRARRAGARAAHGVRRRPRSALGRGTRAARPAAPRGAGPSRARSAPRLRRRAAVALPLPVRVLNAPFTRAARRRTSGVLDALLAGRGWIALVFVLLVGIVFFNVDLLRMNREIAASADRIAVLKRENARDRLDVAQARPRPSASRSRPPSSASCCPPPARCAT